MRVSKEWMTWVGASAIDPLFETWLIMCEFSVDNLRCYVMFVFDVDKVSRFMSI